jgi:hypothetical protein
MKSLTKRNTKRGIWAGVISLLVLFIPTIIDKYFLLSAISNYGVGYITEWASIFGIGLCAILLPYGAAAFFGYKISKGSIGGIVFSSIVVVFVALIQVVLMFIFYLAVFGTPGPE